jgi:CubicO group peptidase (beta-lactamase class C family)
MVGGVKSTSLNKRVLEFIAQKEASGLLPAGTGMAVAVLKDDAVLFSGTYGLRARDRNLLVTPDTLFEISSLTKAFTSTALLMASEEGQVDLARPLNSSKNLLALSDSEASKKVSIADILSHRTGLPSNDLLWYFGSSKREDLLRATGRLELAPGAFGRDFTYSNLMYGVLGHLFGDLVSESWERYVARKVLTPLQMTSTSFGISDEEGNVALSYVGTRRVGRKNMSSIAAAGTLVSSLKDMTRWLAFQLSRGLASGGERLLSEASIELMQSKQVPVENVNPVILQGLEWLSEAEGVSYGLGWFLGSWNGLKAVYHPGLIDGFSTVVLMIPEKRLGFVVLTNLNLSGAPGLLIQDLLGSLLNPDTQSTEAPSSPAKHLLAMTGTYENPAYGTVSITLDGDQLAFEHNGHLWPLAWKGDGTVEFVVTAFGVQLPLTVQVETKSGKVGQLSIPFSLDPRVEPQIFTRR